MNIPQVSKKFDIPIDTLRYYEKVGLIPDVNRRDNGIRDYDEDDVKWVEFIKCMRSAGLPIKVLIEYVSLFRRGDHTREERRDILVEQRAELAERVKEMKKTLKILDYKIEIYETELKKFEKKLKK